MIVLEPIRQWQHGVSKLEYHSLIRNLLTLQWGMDPKNKMVGPDKMEKSILRKAFQEYLPEEIINRQKEQFSDGVGYDWIDTLKSIVNENISDSEFQDAKYTFPLNTPMNKEEYYYRSLFSKYFSSDEAALTVPSVPSIACSSEIAIHWDKSFKNINDPSGRAVTEVHKK